MKKWLTRGNLVEAGILLILLVFACSRISDGVSPEVFFPVTGGGIGLVLAAQRVKAGKSRKDKEDKL